MEGRNGKARENKSDIQDSLLKKAHYFLTNCTKRWPMKAMELFLSVSSRTNFVMV